MKHIFGQILSAAGRRSFGKFRTSCYSFAWFAQVFAQFAQVLQFAQSGAATGHVTGRATGRATFHATGRATGHATGRATECVTRYSGQTRY